MQKQVSGLRFVLRLIVRHPSLDPKLISTQLGLAPHVTQMAGEARVAPSGVPIGGRYSDSRWGWSARFEKRREFFDEVSVLANRLYPHKEFLSKIVDSGGSVEIVVHLPGDTNIGWTMPWAELATLAELKIDLGIEVFPDFK